MSQSDAFAVSNQASTWCELHEIGANRELCVPQGRALACI